MTFSQIFFFFAAWITIMFLCATFPIQESRKSILFLNKKRNISVFRDSNRQSAVLIPAENPTINQVVLVNRSRVPKNFVAS